MGLMTPGSLPRLDVQHLDDEQTALAVNGLNLFMVTSRCCTISRCVSRNIG